MSISDYGTAPGGICKAGAIEQSRQEQSKHDSASVQTKLLEQNLLVDATKEPDELALIIAGIMAKKNSTDHLKRIITDPYAPEDIWLSAWHQLKSICSAKK